MTRLEAAGTSSPLAGPSRAGWPQQSQGSGLGPEPWRGQCVPAGGGVRQSCVQGAELSCLQDTPGRWRGQARGERRMPLFLAHLSLKPGWPLPAETTFKKKEKPRDPWVAQRFSACLWPRARSWSCGIGSHVGLPARSLLLPPPVCLPLCVSHE